jgi:APA family basic amino acid/polyamine antiporter
MTGSGTDGTGAGQTGGPSAHLTRAIRLPHAIAMVVGTIIGASIFVQPSEISGHVPTVAGVFLVWTVSGILTLFGALVCAELASAYPRSGGVYVFLRESFGPWLGFLWGWAMFWTMHSGIIAAIATVFARYTAYFAPMDDTALRAVAVALILVVSAVNWVGVRHGSRLQTSFTAGKLIAIAAIIVFGFLLGGNADGAGAAGAAGMAEAVDGVSAGPAFSAGDFALALVAGLFAYGGWHMVTYSAEETVDAARTIPRALAVGVIVVTVCYILLNGVYLYVLPVEVVASSERIAADAADAVLGTGGGALMAGLVMFSTFGALAGIVLAGPRVYYAMAQDGLVFGWLAGIHPRYRTPHRAIALQAIWSSVLVATGSYRELFTRVIYTEWIFFGLMAVGLLMLRRRGVRGAYRLRFGALVPLVFAVSAFAIVANQVVRAPGESLLGLSMVVVGLPVYLIWGRSRRAGEASP